MAAKDHPLEQILSPVAWNILCSGQREARFTRKNAAAFHKRRSPSKSDLATVSQYLGPLVSLGFLDREYEDRNRVRYTLTEMSEALLAGKPPEPPGAADSRAASEDLVILLGNELGMQRALHTSLQVALNRGDLALARIRHLDPNE